MLDALEASEEVIDEDAELVSVLLNELEAVEVAVLVILWDTVELTVEWPVLVRLDVPDDDAVEVAELNAVDEPLDVIEEVIVDVTVVNSQLIRPSSMIDDRTSFTAAAVSSHWAGICGTKNPRPSVHATLILNGVIPNSGLVRRSTNSSDA